MDVGKIAITAAEGKHISKLQSPAIHALPGHEFQQIRRYSFINPVYSIPLMIKRAVSSIERLV
ncbi:MAG TPA: hypothetical protein PKN50_20955, partial [Spirochaetota bacterium]|nr:hypothetical protein [Spirochaetota bacterium]